MNKETREHSSKLYFNYGYYLFLITLIGFIVRWVRMTYVPIWLDETYTLYFSRMSFSQLFYSELHGEMQNPPLYYIVMHGWLKLFGGSPMALRFPSVLASTLTIPVLYYAMRQWKAPTEVSLLTVFLLALSPSHIYYAHEARAYSLVLLLLITGLYFLGKWMRDNRKLDLWGFVFFCILSYYTSLWSIFWLVIFNLWFIWTWFSRGEEKLVTRGNIKSWIISQVIIILFTLPYLGYLLLVPEATAHGGLHYYAQLKDFIEISAKMGLGVMIPIPKTAYGYAGPVLLLGLLSGIYLCFQKKEYGYRDLMRMGLLLFIVPFLMLFIISSKMPIFLPDRYGIFCLPGYLIIVGIGLSSVIFQKRFYKTGIILILFFIIGTSQSIRVTYRWRKVDLQQIAQYIEQQGNPKDAVGIAPGFWEVNYDYFDASSRPRIQLNSLKDIPNPAQYPRLWFIDIPYTPPSQEVVQQLQNIYPEHRLVKTFLPYYLNLHLYSISSESNPIH